MAQLSGKIALITGAGSGIGKGIARAFAQAGASLVLAGRTAQKLEATAEELRPQGVPLVVVPTDVADEEQVLALFARTMEAFGRLDILVNNAGAFDGGPMEELTLDAWQRVIDVCLTGPFLCSREAFKIMKKQGGGRILNIGSISAQMARMNSLPYTTAKHGLVGMTKATALEGRAFGIAVSCLHPGNTETERRRASDAPQDQEPMMSVDELAAVALTMVVAPAHVNVLEAIVLPVEQHYLGRG